MLESQLGHLESGDLIRRLNEADLAYLFKHALVQDTARASLLLGERKRLHRLVAASLETLYADRLDEFAVRLYQHYDAAGDRVKTIQYAERAGDAASRQSAYAEAVVAYLRALTLTEQHPEDSERRIRLMTRLGRTYEEDFKYDAALALYRRTREDAQVQGDRPLELAALVQLAKVYAVSAMRYDPEQSAQISQQALDLARALGDQHAEARINWAMMLANVYGGKGAREGVVCGERSLALARALDWHEQMAYTLNDLAYTYLNLGNSERALATATEARVLWRELDNKPMLTDNLNSSAMQHLMRGEFEIARALTLECRTLAITIGNRWGEATSHMVDGYLAETCGDTAGALASFRACRDAGDSIGVQGLTVMARFEPSRIYAFLGFVDQSIFFAQDALDRVLQQHIDWEAWARAVLAYAAEQAGDWQTADEAVQKIADEPPEFYFERMLPFGAAEIIYAQIRYELRHVQLNSARVRAEQLLGRVRNSGFTIFVPPALEYLARVLIGENELERAQTALNEGKALAHSLGLLPAQIALTFLGIELESARGNFAGQALAVQETSDLLSKLETNIPPELRASFHATVLGKYLDNARA